MPDHVVAIVCFPGVQALDVTGPHEVFAAASRVLAHRRPGAPGYRLRLVAAEPGPVRTESGLELHAPHPLPLDPADTLIVPGGDGVLGARDDHRLVDAVRRHAASGRRLASVCSGTFVLAEAGALDGRRATTHWRRAERLATEYPAITVDPDPIYVCDGNVWTSAGVTAGIDLALAMVEADAGAEIAQAVARNLVMFLRRPGGQTQFATAVWTEPATDDVIRGVRHRIVAEPAEDHRVEALAAAAHLSTRHFVRRFTEQTGETPARFVERTRVEHARRLLETGDDGVRVIATRCGFGTAETMRRAFLRRVGVTPDDYRKRFR